MPTHIRSVKSLGDRRRAWWRVAVLVLSVFTLSAVGAWPVGVPVGAQMVISTAHSDADHAVAADLDGDGDVDVLSASSNDDKIAWYPNRGGQLALPTIDTSQGVILDGQLEDVLRIEVVHRGRVGDSDAKWVTLEILLEETVGDPLTDTEANASFTAENDPGLQP